MSKISPDTPNSTVRWDQFIQLELTDELFVGLQLVDHKSPLKIVEITKQKRRKSTENQLDEELWTAVRLTLPGSFTRMRFKVRNYYRYNDSSFFRLSCPKQLSVFPPIVPEIMVRLIDPDKLMPLSWGDLKDLTEKISTAHITNFEP